MLVMGLRTLGDDGTVIMLQIVEVIFGDNPFQFCLRPFPCWIVAQIKQRTPVDVRSLPSLADFFIKPIGTTKEIESLRILGIAAVSQGNPQSLIHAVLVNILLNRFFGVPKASRVPTPVAISA